MEHGTIIDVYLDSFFNCIIKPRLSVVERRAELPVADVPYNQQNAEPMAPPLIMSVLSYQLRLFDVST